MSHLTYPSLSKCNLHCRCDVPGKPQHADGDVKHYYWWTLTAVHGSLVWVAAHTQCFSRLQLHFNPDGTRMSFTSFPLQMVWHRFFQYALGDSLRLIWIVMWVACKAIILLANKGIMTLRRIIRNGNDTVGWMLFNWSSSLSLLSSCSARKEGGEIWLAKVLSIFGAFCMRWQKIRLAPSAVFRSVLTTIDLGKQWHNWSYYYIVKDGKFRIVTIIIALSYKQRNYIKHMQAESVCASCRACE